MVTHDNTPAAQSRLLRLPVELQLIIYEFVVVEPMALLLNCRCDSASILLLNSRLSETFAKVIIKTHRVIPVGMRNFERTSRPGMMACSVPHHNQH